MNTVQLEGYKGYRVDEWLVTGYPKIYQEVTTLMFRHR